MPEEMFGERTSVIMDNAVPDLPRLESLWRNAHLCALLPGAFAELGVYKGGSALLMYEAGKRKKAIHLFDTFTGIPFDDNCENGHVVGDFTDTSVDYVRFNIFQDANNVLIHKGLFPASAERFDRISYAMVHMDADLYQSTVDGIAYFWPRLVKGGRIVFDDYDWYRCPGVKRAIKQFFDNMGLTDKDAYFVQEAHYQMTVVKL